MKTRDESLALLHRYVASKNLRKHMYATEAAMRSYARQFSEDEDWWGQVGLLHDFDYEKYPNLQDHPSRGAEILAEEGYPHDFIETILAHAPHTGTPRDSKAKKTIFAIDELAGFIVAVALVRPSKKIADVKVKSVKKKLKDKGFARPVNRKEIYQGADELGIPLDTHIETVLKSIQGIAGILGL